MRASEANAFFRHALIRPIRFSGDPRMARSAGVPACYRWASSPGGACGRMWKLG
jgi:hypothetical protein